MDNTELSPKLVNKLICYNECMLKYTEEVFEKSLIEACKTSISMRAACKQLGMHYNTFLVHAKRLGIYKTNQSGKGTSKANATAIPLNDILAGKYPAYNTHRLKTRILKENIRPHVCEHCNSTEWAGFPIPLELHHVNGVNNDHRAENVQLICPNCHALTSNYRGKNKGKV